MATGGGVNYATMADNIASRVAQQYGIDPNYFRSIFHAQINQESGFNPRAHSGAGAQGIAQIVPKWHPGVDPYNPQAALMYAAKWDAQNYKKYGNAQDVLSVYNSGRPWAQGQGISETNNYVHSILSAAGHPQASTRVPGAPSAGLFGQGNDMSQQRNALIQGILQWASGGSQSASQPPVTPGQGNFNPMAQNSGSSIYDLVNAAWGTPGANKPKGGPPPVGLFGGKPQKFDVGRGLHLVGIPSNLATHSGIDLNAPIANAAEQLARKFGVKINSGYRSAQHNAAVGGAKGSDHLSGDAVDYTGSPAAMRALYNYALKAGYAYVEPWAQAGGNHVHISFARGVKA